MRAETWNANKPELNFSAHRQAKAKKHLKTLDKKLMQQDTYFSDSVIKILTESLVDITAAYIFKLQSLSSLTIQ